ncbi:MAG: permease [Candidatus Omnitrophota bacterium]
MARDPICGMKVDEKQACALTHEGVKVYFCSSHCREKFIAREHIHDVATCAPQTRSAWFKNKLLLVSIVVVLLLLGALVIPALAPFQKIFLSYARTLAWAIVFGLLLGGLIDYYVPQEYISKVLARRHPSTILYAVGLGFLMSACSHGILALSIQLHKKGASTPAVISFLLASPWANFTITLMLVSFFGLKGLLIIVAAIMVAVTTGLAYMVLERRGLVEKNKNTVPVSEDFSIRADIRSRIRAYRFTRDSAAKDCIGVLRGAAALAQMVLWWVIIGILIASALGAYVPAHVFSKYMGPSLLGLIVTLALATVIEVCSEGSSPLAFEIYRQTQAFGNSFVFLMAGVATDYTEIGLIWSNVGRRAALWLPLVAVPQILVLGFLFNLFFK